MGRLGKYIRPYWAYILLTVFIKTVGSVMDLFIPFLMEVILDDMVPAKNMQGIYLYGGLMILCAALCLTLGVMRGEDTVVWRKAVNVCMECIGLG